jgi:Protein of unknown function (DUF2997)
MKELRIVVEIDYDGRITADADGFAGDACLTDLAKLLKGLAEQESVARKSGADEKEIQRRAGRNLDLRRDR